MFVTRRLAMISEICMILYRTVAAVRENDGVNGRKADFTNTPKG